MAHFEQIILSTLTYIAFLVVACCFALHLKNHFGLTNSICNNFWLTRLHSNESTGSVGRSSISRQNTNQNNQSVICCCYSLTGRIEFYPVSTVCYFAFLLCSILYIGVFHYKYYQYTSENMNYCPITSNTLTFMNNPLSVTSFIPSPTNNYAHISSYIVLLLVLWETLFNFYRFYDAKHMSRYLRNASKTRISALFSIYMFIFSSLYLAQIHLYFGLFPVIVLIHFIFNVYCSIGFVAILQNQYTHLWEGEIEQLKSNRMTEELFEIINRVRICSMVTTLISTSFLFIVTGCHTSCTMILLPSFWMISSIVWMLNFSKNKSSITKTYDNIKHKIFLCNNNNNNNTINEPKFKTLQLKPRNDSAIPVSIKMHQNNDKLKQNEANTNENKNKVTEIEDTQKKQVSVIPISIHKPRSDAAVAAVIIGIDVKTENESQLSNNTNNILNNNISIPSPIQTFNPLSKTKSLSKNNEFPKTTPRFSHAYSSTGTIDYGGYKKDNENYNNKNSVTPCASPVTPCSYEENANYGFGFNGINGIPVISGNLKSLSKHKMNNNAISVTPGLQNKIKKDVDLHHNRSLSTMSGLDLKRRNEGVIAASSILHMMVNQGFYSKSNLKSVNQIANIKITM